MADVTVAVAGNPNVGKSTIFNALTGLKQHTGNWAGKTVGNAEGYFKTRKNNYTLVDIPGTYSLLSISKEEEIARDFLMCGGVDIVIAVCDATCLERNLNLVLQLLSIHSNVVLCVNLMDEARRKGIIIDLDALSDELKIPVVGTVAREKRSLKKLTDTLDLVCDSMNEKSLKNLHNYDKSSSLVFVKRAAEIVKNTVKFEENKSNSDRFLDKLFTGKLIGYFTMLFFLCVILWITVWGANYISDGLSLVFSKTEAGLIYIFSHIGFSNSLQYIIIEAVFRVPFWVIAVMLPPMAIFFPLFTFLEDAGYLPRVAFNLDKPFMRCKSCGKQALTMCMGFGCNSVGVTGARIIDSKRERLLAILTNSFVPCNGRFPIITAVISAFLVSSNGLLANLESAIILTLFIVLSIAVTMLATFILSVTVLRGIPNPFILEMPPYRKPQTGKIIVRSIFDRTLFVLGRALTSAIPASVIIFLLANIDYNNTSLLILISQILDPIGSTLGLDGMILLGFVLGFPANEIVVPIILMGYLAGKNLTQIPDISIMRQILIENGWTVNTAVCTVVFSLFHWPCATTVLTVKKETKSLKWAAVSIALPTLFGIIFCVLITFIFSVF